MMPHSIFFRAGPGQSPSLWVRPGAIAAGPAGEDSPEGSAASARSFCDREPDPEAFCERRRTDSPGTWMPERTAQSSFGQQSLQIGAGFLRRSAAALLNPSRGPSQPHKVGDTRSCLRQRRRLFHSVVHSGRPNRAPIEAADSIRMQCRYKASMMTVPAYQRQGCSQSGNRLIVWPQTRHKNRRTQMTIQPVSTRPRTCRRVHAVADHLQNSFGIPGRLPASNAKHRDGDPQDEGASALRAQSCSTVDGKAM